MTAPACIAHVDAERGFSGGEVQVFLLMNGLTRRGYRNVLCCPPGSRAAEEAARRGIEVCAVPMRADVDVAAVWRLARAFRRTGAALVHLHTGRAAWLGGWAAALAGLPAVVTRRMDRPVQRGWRTRLIYGRFARRVAAVSPGVADCLVAGGVARERIAVIASTVDPERVRLRRGRDVLRAELGAAPGDAVLLVAASLVRRKGVDVLLDALAALAAGGVRPPLWVAGDGPERAALEAQTEARGLGAQVRWLGRRDDVGDLLAACDVVIMPSRREGLGVAALEAMAAGRPVVASAVGGLRDAVVDGRTGMLVPAEDAGALAEAVSRIVSDAAFRRQLGAAGPDRVAEGFLAEQMVAAYDRLYRELLGPENR